jgi:hypothetical protein
LHAPKVAPCAAGRTEPAHVVPGRGGPDERLTPRAAAWFLLLLSPLLFDSEALHTHL